MTVHLAGTRTHLPAPNETKERGRCFLQDVGTSVHTGKTGYQSSWGRELL